MRVPVPRSCDAHLDIDRAIGMDGQIAIAGVAASAPGVNGQSEPRLHMCPAGLVAARMPVLLPAHQFVGDGELFAV